MKKTIIIGLVVGIILATVGTFNVVGKTIYTLFDLLWFLFYDPLMKIIGCYGRNACVGPGLLINGLIIILVSILSALFISLSYKHFIKRERNKRTKFVLVYDLLFIGLMLFSYLKGVCLSNEFCIIKIASISNSDFVCKYSPYSTRFVFNDWFGEGEHGCYVKLALVTKDDKHCEELLESDQNGCYVQLSRIKGDISICEKIHVEEYDESDEKASRMNSAIILSAQRYRDYCYKNIALLTKDISKCELIQGNDNKQLCLAILNNDRSYCENISKGMSMMSKDARKECEIYFK